MKIPNYDPDFSSANRWMQGDPCMPADAFRMLICGPSNSGKTNILLHMLYELLEFDKVFLFAKNLHQDKYQALLQDFAENVDPEAGYEVVEASGDEITPLEDLPLENQKIVIFDDLVCESNQKSIINYFTHGRHRNCGVIYLAQSFFKVPKEIRDNCTHFCVFDFSPQENNQIADKLGVERRLLDRAVAKKFSFLYVDKPQKTVRKNFDEDI